MSDIQQLITAINEFLDERNWRAHHNPKDLAISISIEAAELLEDFQWRSSEEAIEENIDNIKDEIADVMIYTLMLCDGLGLDPKELIEKKIVKNGVKYPAPVSTTSSST
ncbi:nucleotide pyrophosphohydrolase [Paenisporosarcina cavernae]|uniref:Nucleotide pyrophosphohydrolase n=1 Tax=Paenisporosarcina cavernae TaxID=2320858 RepID=A0A385YQ55_9BACL|nr:nucleotide pyrophosphohydrolase [Paenisporosarcina cavernae]AYC28480.1 nucleotide pyrophosphohydrolase [Paenisporosarcina cavernae]